MKFFIIAWFTIAGQPVHVSHVVNTSLEFNLKQDCELYLALEYDVLQQGVERYLNHAYADKKHTINEISCASAEKVTALQ